MRTDRRVETASGLLEMRKLVEIDRAELRKWRERYPTDAKYVREAAMAEVEDRDPRYIPPTVIG